MWCNETKQCSFTTTLAKKMAATIMHKIRTLFLSCLLRNITRLARWRGWPRLRALLHRSAIKLDFSISHARNSVLILCIIVVAVLFFGQGSSSRVSKKGLTKCKLKKKKAGFSSIMKLEQLIMGQGTHFFAVWQKKKTEHDNHSAICAQPSAEPNT